MKPRFFAAAVSAIALLAGCGRSPQTTFYTLTPLSVPAETLQAVPHAPTVSIAAVSLPELVDRPQLVVPDQGSQVLVLEGQRWAEPLKSAIPRVLAEDLARLIGAERVSAYPQYAAGRADYRIFIDLQRFETTGQAVLVDALWTLKPSTDGRVTVRRSQFKEPLQGGGYEALVQAYSRALAGLATAIAKEVAQL